MITKINIKHLLESGKRLNPCDLIIRYRYKITTDKPITLSVWGTSNNKGYVCLGHQTLNRVTDHRVPLMFTKDFNVNTFQLKTATATGLFIYIDNAEFIEIKKIDFRFNEASKLTGRPMDCSPYYPPYPEVGYSVNPFAYVEIPTTISYNVNPMAYVETVVYAVNPLAFTEVRQYSVNSFVFVDTTVYNVNPLVFSSFEAYSVNPMVFKKYELFAVNPLVIIDETVYNSPLMWIGFDITPPIEPNNSLMWISETYIPTAPTITKVDNTIVME